MDKSPGTAESQSPARRTDRLISVKTSAPRWDLARARVRYPRTSAEFIVARWEITIDDKSGVIQRARVRRGNVGQEKRVVTRGTPRFFAAERVPLPDRSIPHHGLTIHFAYLRRDYVKGDMFDPDDARRLIALIRFGIAGAVLRTPAKPERIIIRVIRVVRAGFPRAIQIARTYPDSHAKRIYFASETLADTRSLRPPYLCPGAIKG